MSEILRFAQNDSSQEGTVGVRCKTCQGPVVTLRGRPILSGVNCEKCAIALRDEVLNGPYLGEDEAALPTTGRPRNLGNEQRIVQAITDHDGVTAADIVRITGLPMGTVYTYVVSLRAAGKIRALDNTRRYKKYVSSGTAASPRQ